MRRQESMPRIGSGGKGDDLNANDRPYRGGAAAAIGQECGHGVDHGAAAIRPQLPAVKDFRELTAQTRRKTHSTILAITSPNSKSAADQIKAETKLAIWNDQYGISKIPAASGTDARRGPKNRPMKMLGTPHLLTKASPRGRISG